MNSKAIIAGAVSGFAAAFVVDIHAWAGGDGAYNWVKAVKRWIAGAVSGAATAAGFGGMIS